MDVFGWSGKCLCHTVYSYFDYWGKGTMVTVSSDTSKAPTSLFPLMNCGTLTNDKYSVGCLATGFTPSYLTFKWTDAKGTALTDFVQYPAVQTGGAYTAVSQLQVAKNDWENAKSFTCVVEHPAGSKTEVINKPVITSPTVFLLSQSSGSTQYLMCLIEDFQPKTITVTWKKNGQKVEGPTSIVGQQKSSGLFGASSVLKVSNTEWASNAKYKCEVGHKSKLISQEIFKSEPLTLTLNPPKVKEIFVNNQVVMECIINGTDTKELNEAIITWKVNKQSRTDGIIEVVKNDQQIPRKVSNLNMNRRDWGTVNTVQCSAETNGITRGNQELVINHGCKDLSATVHILPEKDIESLRSDNSDVTLVCLVVSPSLCDFYIMWKEKVDTTSTQYEGITSPPQINPEGKYTSTSVFTTTRGKWNNNVIFSCSVIHSGLDAITAPTEIPVSNALEKNQDSFPVTDCSKKDDEEDEFRSLWSTSATFIILFFLSITYSAVISLVKMEQ